MAYYFDYTPLNAQGQAALAAGQAGARRENTIRSLEAGQQAQMQGSQIAASMDQQALALANAAQQRGFDRDFAAGQNDVNFRQQQQLNQDAQQAYAARDAAQQQQAKDLIEYELTAKQKQKIASLNEANQTIADMERRQEFTPQQAAYARYSVQSQLSGIQPMPVPRQKLPTIQERVAQDTWTGEDGRTWIQQADGSLDMKMPPSKSVDTETARIELDTKIAERDAQKAEQDARLAIIKEANLAVKNSYDEASGTTSVDYEQTHVDMLLDAGLTPRRPVGTREKPVRVGSVADAERFPAGSVIKVGANTFEVE